MLPMCAAAILGGAYLVCSVIDAILALRGFSPEMLAISRKNPKRGAMPQATCSASRQAPWDSDAVAFARDADQTSPC